jgi:hypothetical protein
MQCLYCQGVLVAPTERQLAKARVVKLVDTADLKSAAYLKRGVPVQVRPRAPILYATRLPSRFLGYFDSWISRRFLRSVNEVSTEIIPLALCMV